MSEFVFFNIWQSTSPEAQQALVDAMRREAPALAAKNGFLSLTAWTGQARDYRVIVEGRWRSRDAFEAAVACDPKTLESRARLEQHGHASPGVFVQSLHVLPSTSNILKEKIPTTSVVLRVSVLRCDPPDFERFRTMTMDAQAVLQPGIEAMPGLLAFYAGADAANHSLINTSVWETLEHAQQMDRFAPMLELGKRFTEAGARFERPIMNHAVLWSFGPLTLTR